MNAPVNALATRGVIADTLDQIFEPIRFETLADVFASYRRDRQRMVEIARLFDGSNAALVAHFVAANIDRSSYVNTDRLFALDPALKALDASYWQRALELTDVLEAMPQKRRDEWHELVRSFETPAFEETTVISTLQDLLVHRHKFFAERVDGIFRALSHEHVTNRPEGFSRRMIIAYVASGGYTDWSRCGTIGDLRCVIARFMGRQEPRHYDTTRVVEFAQRKRCGQWVSIDGGSLRIRVYKNGNAHLEVHPEMAWRLNNVLASIYPNAIAEEHRRRPNRKPPKDFVFYSRPLPTVVLQLLADGRFHRARDLAAGVRDVFDFHFDASKSRAYEEACGVLAMLGGVQTREGTFEFDYPVAEIIADVEASGVLPDQRAHQYYATPADLAERVVAAAQIESSHTVLEPSAGMGALARLLPKTTTLVEVAQLHCEILRAKGFTSVLCTDFLRWSPGRRFDRIVMNPPFAGGQWERHIEHAASLLAEGGRIVAVLPAGARERRNVLPGWSCTWSTPEPFPGTSIEVTVLVAQRAS